MKTRNVGGSSFARSACTLLGSLLALLNAGPVLAERTATATAIVSYGFVVHITVTDGGAGYVVPPTVSITGGGGSGATAVATLTNGMVHQVTVVNPGINYTNTPTVTISAPPQETRLQARLVPELTVTGEPGEWVEIQWAPRVDRWAPGGNSNQWTTIANVQIAEVPVRWFDTSDLAAKRFYRTVKASLVLPMGRMVWIPPGSFVMGSPTNEPLRGSDEVRHTVNITQGFYMSKYEVTQGEFLSVVGSNPSFFTGSSNLPVESVTWSAATNYCARLTAREAAAGRLPAEWTYRLPTEAEWEYACRAGTTTAYTTGSTLDKSLANYNPGDGTAVGKPTPVGSYPPNAWGLYDMMGNEWEWCQDLYGAYPTNTVSDPAGAATGTARVFRGGAWYFDKDQTRSAWRGSVFTTLYNSAYGFRVVVAPVRP